MAEKLNGADGGAVFGDDTEDHKGVLTNKGARADCIRNGFLELARQDEAIAAAVNKHVKPLRQDRAKTWKDLRNDVDMKAADLKPHYQLYRRARDASDHEDDGDTALDNLREIHEALHPGEQLDWVAAVHGNFGDAETQAAA